MSRRPGGWVVLGLMAAIGASCSSPGQAPRDPPPRLTAPTPVPIDAAAAPAPADAAAPPVTDAGAVSAVSATDAGAGRPASVCQARRWGGWQGTAVCRAAAARTIAAADQRCATDEDCRLIGTSCDPHAVSATAASRYASWPPPCTPPGAGNCSGPTRAICDDGCCLPDLLRGLR